MNNIIESTNQLEEKLKLLLTSFNELKQENEFLQNKLVDIQEQLTEKEQQFDELSESYNLLKVAKTIEGSNKSIKDTKLKINALIHQIDQCILQLSK